MASLKFRAWDRKRKEWYGSSSDDILTFYGFGIFGECTMLCMPPVEYLQYLEITQFTGLLDKNGKEIYEGDVVKTLSFDRYDEDYSEIVLATVVYSGQSFYAKYLDENLNRQISGGNGFVLKSSVEVIGNIYENRDLLQ